MLFCLGFSNILTSISTSLHQTADKSSKPPQNEKKTEEQWSTMPVMLATYDRTQVECAVYCTFLLKNH